MEIFTKVNGLTEKLMEMDALHKFMKDLSTTENGTWTPCMARAILNGTLENARTKATSKTDKELEKEFTKRELKHILDRLKTDNSMEKEDMFSIIQNHIKKKAKLCTKENLKIIKSLEELNITLMVLFIKVNSKTTICMEVVASSIQMEQFLLVPLKIMKSMVWVHSLIKRIT